MKLIESLGGNKRKSTNAKIFSRFRLFMYDEGLRNGFNMIQSDVIQLRGLTLTTPICAPHE